VWPILLFLLVFGDRPTLMSVRVVFSCNLCTCPVIIAVAAAAAARAMVDQLSMLQRAVRARHVTSVIRPTPGRVAY